MPKSNTEKAEESSLSSAKIFADIEAQPPLMRDEAAEAYLGQEVDWALTFASGSKDNSGNAHLSFHISNEVIRGVQGTVSLSEYPWLKSLRADEPVRVRGRIRAISTLSIELEIGELVLAGASETGLTAGQ